MIRKAAGDDLPAVEKLVLQYRKPSVDHTVELDKKDSVFLVSEMQSEDGSSVKEVALMRTWEWNGTGYVLELAVDPEFKRKGIGKMLIGKLSEVERKIGLRAVMVEIQPGNRDAMDFYLSNGFRLCGINGRYYTNFPNSSKDIAIFFCLNL